ncbi:hypothetical protein NDU88_005537 [Pleurodeles waltl]|uniref:Uncharacterized protein n=1 Tax=Pleurodeles waltl TaxID=8319 RepID=A0AAV7RMH1_PLEWA|nr:hypothetical protein NDU88_005537 [Pleurodeles waltl]
MPAPLCRISNCGTLPSPRHLELLQSLTLRRVGPQSHVRPRLGARSRAATPHAPHSGGIRLTLCPVDDSQRQQPSAPLRRLKRDTRCLHSAAAHGPRPAIQQSSSPRRLFYLVAGPRPMR